MLYEALRTCLYFLAITSASSPFLKKANNDGRKVREGQGKSFIPQAFGLASAISWVCSVKTWDPGKVDEAPGEPGGEQGVQQRRGRGQLCRTQQLHVSVSTASMLGFVCFPRVLNLCDWRSDWHLSHVPRVPSPHVQWLGLSLPQFYKAGNIVTPTRKLNHWPKAMLLVRNQQEFKPQLVPHPVLLTQVNLKMWVFEDFPDGVW